MKNPKRMDLLQGTLDLLILRTLESGPAHGHAISQSIRAVSDEVLQVESGLLYPALHRLEDRGWIEAEWKTSDKGKRAKYYRLHSDGRKQLAVEQSKWERFSEAMTRALKPVEPEEA